MVDSESDPGARPPHLDENIDTVLEVQKRDWEQRSLSHRFVERISRAIGRPLYLAGLFGFAIIWIALNLSAPQFGRTAFDPLPFPLLDGLLTLAALVSTTIILISQNRQTRIEQHHQHMTLQVTLMTDQKVAKIVNLLEELRRDLPMVRDRYDPQAASYSRQTDPLQVLRAVEEGGLIDDPSKAPVPPAAAPGPK